MNPPDEIMVKFFLPNIRGLIAHKLREKNYSQGKIAQFLSVSQASVSYMFSKNQEYFYSNLKKIGLNEDEIKNLIDLIIEDFIIRSPMESFYTLYSFWKNLLSSGRLCEFHKRMFPTLANCDVCITLFRKEEINSEKQRVLKEVEKAVTLIENDPYFPLIMPEVAVNIVMAINNAQSKFDVAAIPGRIVRIKNKAKALLKPEFGASNHMAKVLLLVMSFNPSIKAAINIKYDSKIETIIKNMGIKYTFTSIKHKYDILEKEDIILNSIASMLKKSKDFYDIIIDKGSFGIEPITYIFGKEAISVVKIAIEIAKRYAETFINLSSI
jgi:predicted fused transcriptional regulator/phosphomethylpyrimidine kinase/predicted transcriptional regulator